MISLFTANKTLKPEDVEVLVLDVLAIETHEKAFNHVIEKFGKVSRVSSDGSLELNKLLANASAICKTL